MVELFTRAVARNELDVRPSLAYARRASLLAPRGAGFGLGEKYISGDEAFSQASAPAVKDRIVRTRGAVRWVL